VVYSGSFFLVIPSPVVFCLSTVSQYLSSSIIHCSVLLVSCTGSPLLYSFKVALGVPSRGHLVKQFIFPAVMQTSLPLLRKQMLTWTLAGNGRLFLTFWNVFIEGDSATDRSVWLLCKRVSTIRYLAIDISLCSGIGCHNIPIRRSLIESGDQQSWQICFSGWNIGLTDRRTHTQSWQICFSGWNIGLTDTRTHTRRIMTMTFRLKGKTHHGIGFLVSSVTSALFKPT
jgi:hypothetical protein